jgi:hypothetical protein
MLKNEIRVDKKIFLNLKSSVRSPLDVFSVNHYNPRPRFEICRDEVF